MMNTWFTEMISNSNEAIFCDADLTRFMNYFASMPARLKLNDELQALESSLGKLLSNELSKRFPNRALYSKRFVQDIIESLRYVNRAVLADDVRILRYRWLDHVLDVAAAMNIDVQEIRDAYLVLRDLLKKSLPRSAWDALEPFYEEILDSLTRNPRSLLAV